jgi:very-short-patch-repair endonuclease
MMDDKLNYLVKTLSRTKRKDYENYVINAIWNRVNNPYLVPISQHFVKDSNGDYYYIDLYFPQLNIGIECDEAHHKQQKIADAARTCNIGDVLYQGGGEGFVEIRIDITKSFDDVESQINNAVDIITAKIKEVNITNGWDLLNPDPKTYFANKTVIRVSDNVVFRTNNDVCNIVLGKDYRGNQQQMITLSNGMYAWLPTKMDVNHPNSKGYSNKISKDGLCIYENTDDAQARQARMENDKHIGEIRVVFAKTKDPITNISGYRFIGVFVGDHYEADGTLVYNRDSNVFEIIK